MDQLAHAAIVLAIYLAPFFLLGWLVKKFCDRWMRGKGLEAEGVAEFGRGTSKRRVGVFPHWNPDA